jgi:iron(III) transport system ATP-binding protein
MARISIQGLNKSLGGQPIVKQLDLEVEDKEFVAILGPSGCGKTTTLRLLAGFLKPDSGTIRVDGQVISSSGAVVPPERRRMGMVFQQYAVWPHMDVAANVAFGLTCMKLPADEIRSRVEEVLRLVGLTGLDRRYASQLSGGQQQRVALARALVVEPSILLLDEPLSNLDAKMRERMRFELKVLQERTGITFVYVTHDQTEAMALSDHLAVMEDGRLVQWGTPRDVYERPASSFVADFMGLVNWVDGVISDQKNPDVVTIGEGMQLRAVVPAGLLSGSRVRVAIRPDDLAVTAERPANGENVFPARVTEALFLGNLIHYQLDIGELRLIAQVPRSEAFQVGDRVYVRVFPDTCNVLPAT